MHAADIKAALQKKEKPPVKVARELKVRPSVVSQVIHGKAASRRIARRISEIVGIPVSRLWPGRYPRLELEELRRAA
jgi:lambda repressor-like predicted transcriptional regulator